MDPSVLRVRKDSFNGLEQFSQMPTFCLAVAPVAVHYPRLQSDA
jgi:hypothetical protein